MLQVSFLLVINLLLSHAVCFDICEDWISLFH